MENNKMLTNIENFLLYCEKGKVKKCIEVIENGINVNDIYERSNEILDIALTKVLMNLFQAKKSSLKAARLRRCLDYLLNIEVDYSKCYISFFTAACITSNIYCSDKLLKNGFDINQEYRGHKSYFDHILCVSLLRYGRFVKRKRKNIIYKTRMDKINYLLDIEGVDYTKCLDSIFIMMDNNQIDILNKIISEGVDLNKKVDNTILIDKLFLIELNKKKRKNINWLQNQNADYSLCIETMNKVCGEKNEKIALFFIASKINFKSLYPENEVWVSEQLIQIEKDK